MKLLLCLFLAWLPVAALGAVSVIVEWDANVEPEVVGYRVLIGSSPRTYTRTNSVAGRLTTRVTIPVGDLPGQPGQVYIAVVAYADDGRVSGFSNEVSWTNHFSATVSAPARVRVRTVITIDGTP